jgi:biopolymer transport protein ExbD
MIPTELQFSGRKNSEHRLHRSLHIDMTPMVDLGFLLITFFILTAALSEQKAMKLFMPEDKGPFTPVGETKVLTVLLSQNHTVFAYEGKLEEAIKNQKIFRTSYDESEGIGNLIRLKQQQLQQTDKKEGRNGLFF